jgi:hypothetical protein
MKKDNPFDKALAARDGHIPDSLASAAVETTDTLVLCWDAVQAVFGDKAQPEHAIMLLPIFIEQAAEKRQQLRAGDAG